LLTGAAVFDTDVPANALTFELLSAPAGMSVEPATGGLTWTPAESQVPSTNWVTLRVRDNGMPSLTATQSFTVFALPINRLPVLIVPPDQTIDEMTTLTLTNEASEAAYPELRLTFGLLDPPAGVVMNPTNGVFTWTPTENQGPGTNLILVVVRDDGFPSVTVTQSFSVVVREINRAPVWLVQPDVRLREGDTLDFSLAAANGLFQEVWTGLGGGTVFDLTNNFAFPDQPTTWGVLTNGFEAPCPGVNYHGQRLRGFLVPAETGAYVFALHRFWDFGWGACLLYLSTDETSGNKVAIAGWAGDFQQPQSAPIELAAGGRYYVEALMVKGGGAFNSQAINWQIPGGWVEAPIPASRLVPFAGVRDPDWPANELSYQLIAGPEGADLNPATGQLSWTPASTQRPSTNVFVVAVSDNGTPSLGATQKFTVVVSDAPELTLPETATVDELTTLTLPLRVRDVSVPPNVQTFDLVSGPVGMTLNPASGVLTWTPSEAQGPSTNLVTVRVTDDGSPPRSDTRGFSVVVNEVNAAPIWTAVQNPTLTLGQSLDFNLASLTNHGLWREVYAGIAGDLIADLTNHASFPDHPTSVEILTNYFAAPVNVDDNYGQRIRAWVVPPRTGLYTFWISSANESLLYLSGDNQPGNKVVIAGLTAGAVPRSPPIRLIAGRAYYIEALMKAGVGDDSLSVSWQLPDRTDELLFPASWCVLDPGTAVVASDPDVPANGLSFELLSCPGGMSVNPATGGLTWTPTEAQAPTTNVVIVRARDDGSPGLSATQSFAVFVRPPNPRAPTLAPIPDQALDELTPLTFTNQAGDADLGEQLSFWLLQAPAGASVDETNGVFTWTPAESQGPSSNWITLVVSDDGVPSLSATQSFAVIVRDVNTPPTWLPIADETVLPGDMLTVLPRGLLREIYEGITSYVEGGQVRWAVANLTSLATYPAQPLSTILVTNMSEFASGMGPGRGQRARGYFAPPETATYEFLCWGSESQVYLSSDEQPDNRRQVWWTWGGGGSGFPSQMLDTGRLYYVEIISAAPSLTFWKPLPGAGLFGLAATDADLPENLLAYEVLAGPAGLRVNPITGQVVWTPGLAQAPSTNVVTLKVSDDGTPSLSATQNFTIVVLENHPPTASLNSPTNGTVIIAPTAILLEAVAEDVDGNLEAVEFFDDTRRLAEVASAPFRFVCTNAAAGPHSLTVRARDRAGVTTDSAPVTITVRLPVSPRWTESQLLADGGFRLSLTGEGGYKCVIEASTNLAHQGEWAAVWTNIVSEGGSLEFTDLAATNFVQRFYRARQEP
jgi:hypothetical protein